VTARPGLADEEDPKPMRRRITRLALGVAAVAVLLATFGTASAFAQQVTGLEAVQQDGFTTLTWSTVAGATDYQIERTPVDEANTPTGTAVIVGVWRPNRTITPESPAFAYSALYTYQQFLDYHRANEPGRGAPVEPTIEFKE
jgi:hypothetical protein